MIKYKNEASAKPGTLMKSCGDEYHLRGKIRLDIEVYCKYQEIPADEPTKCDPGGADVPEKQRPLTTRTI
ncbi:MAG: hypothetical protein AB1815_00105 [Bacillota bacterium]